MKGIDTILRAFISFRDKNPLEVDAHLVLLCPDSSALSAYANEINELRKELPSEQYTFITDFDEQLPLVMLTYELTKCIILASRFETFGLSSLEALAFRERDIFILYSKIPTFEEVLSGKDNTKGFSPGDYLELADDLKTVVLMAKSYLPAAVHQRSDTNLVDEKYDLVKNYSYGLSNFIHEFTDVKEI